MCNFFIHEFNDQEQEVERKKTNRHQVENACEENANMLNCLSEPRK